MAHKTLIGGTAYEVSGGKTLVNGTAYAIKNGKTLVGGTAYEVGFGEIVIVSIVAPPYPMGYNSEYARVTINGVVYDGSSVVDIPVKVGTVIECYIYVENSTSGGISVDGEYKVKGTTGTYMHTVESNCSISCTGYSLSVMGKKQIQGSVIITTET